jgi:hypothetical protein
VIVQERKPQPEVGLRFHVRGPTGVVEVLLVDANCALIGTAAHCEVRLPAGHGAPEHVEVIAMSGVVHFVTRPGHGLPLLNGAPCAAGPYPPGATLEIGNVAIIIEIVDLTPAHRTRSPFWAFAPVPVLAAVVLLVATRSSPAAEAVIPRAPALLDAPVTTCPNAVSPTLPAYAAERARIGLAKRERSPFAPADGIEAVALLETAAACYRIVAMPEAERDASTAAASLRGRLEEEYHVRRVRVEHAFKVADPAGAKRELAVLIPMTAHRRGAYADWLASVDRYATLSLEQRSTRRL